MKGTNGPGETRFFPKNLVSDPASDARSRRDLTVWVTLFFLLVWALFTHAHVGSFNDRSRLAAIESRVARGTWIIDESPFSRTVDRIFVDGHFYSDKPPVLTFIASGCTLSFTGAFISRWTPVRAILTSLRVTVVPCATTTRIGPTTCSH